MENSTEVVLIGGTYKHYKGPLYKVHQVVVHSETLEELVMYECLYENKLGQFWVRPKELFLGKLENGTQRFSLLKKDDVTTL